MFLVCPVQYSKLIKVSKKIFLEQCACVCYACFPRNNKLQPRKHTKLYWTHLCRGLCVDFRSRWGLTLNKNNNSTSISNFQKNNEKLLVKNLFALWSCRCSCYWMQLFYKRSWTVILAHCDLRYMPLYTLV